MLGCLHFLELIKQLLQPLGFGLGILGFAFWSLRTGLTHCTARLILFGFFVLYLPSLPITARYLVVSLENAFPKHEIESYPSVDAIVVLGGTVRHKNEAERTSEEVLGNRLLKAFFVYRAQKAQKVLVSSGIRYLDSSGIERTEADDMAEILNTYGVPLNDIILERHAMNTAENAKYSLAMAKERQWKKILLVTSAYHMRRANAWFKNSDIEVVPVPSGFIGERKGLCLSDFLPSALALYRSTNAIKELIGYLLTPR